MQLLSVQFSQFGLAVSMAFGVNVATLLLPVVSGAGPLAPAIAQTLQAQVSPDSGQRAQDQLSEADRLLDQAIQQRKTSRYQEAMQLTQTALELYQNAAVRQAYPQESRSGEARALHNLGTTYGELSQPEQAIEYYQQALPLYRAVNDRSGEARALTDLGVDYGTLRQHEQAIDYFEQALLIFQAIGNRDEEAMALANLGVSYANLRQLQRAIDYYEQALPIFRAANDSNWQAVTLMNLGTAYANLRRYQQAIDYFQEALPLYRAVNDRSGEGFLLAAIGRVYAAQNSPVSAIEQLQKSVQVRQAIRAELRGLPQADQQAYTDSIADDYRLLAELLRQQNRDREAQAVLDLL